MAASLLSQACLVQSKLSFSPKILQSPRLIPHQHHCVSSPLAFLLKEQSGFVPKASLTAVTAQSNSNSSIPKKKFKNPVIVIDNYDSFTYNLCQVRPEFAVFVSFVCYSLFLMISLHAISLFGSQENVGREVQIACACNR